MALPQEKYYTLADALTWDETEHIELIGGIPIEMQMPFTVHQKIRGNLGVQLANYAHGKACNVFFVPLAVRLFERNNDCPENVDTMVVPDIIVVCDSAKLDDIGCKGAPDLVIEILSPSTRRHDRFTKFNLYQRAGVREYWIVDPDGKDVQTFVLEDGRYSAKDYGAAGDQLKVSILEDCVIDLSLVFAEEQNGA